MRNPLYVVQLSDARKPMSTFTRVASIFGSMGFVIIVFFARSVLMIRFKRNYDERLTKKYSTDEMATVFMHFKKVDQKEEESGYSSQIDIDW